MCGRYYIEIDEEELRTIVDAAQADYYAHIAQEQLQIQLKLSGEIFPSDVVPIISMERRPVAMRWGFTKSAGKGLIINARSETANQLYTFRRAMQESRCLIPASGYYEWSTAEDSNQKRKHALSTGEPVLYMAGLYRQEPDEQLPRFVVLTKDAAPGIAHIHNRMPVILPRAARRAWLTGDLNALGLAVNDIYNRLV